MIYSIYEIQQRIAPVAKQYGVKAVFLFGSYARGEAREEDVYKRQALDSLGTIL